ncbi:MAG: MauE/DoxX family redox-associated membrane protein [Actinomycetota bacterium]
MSRWLPLTTRLVCRLLPAGLLLWAGLAKAFDRQSSILAVDSYEVLPDAGVRLLAAALPWIEIAVAILLVLGLFVRFAGLATAALGVLFIAAMAQAKARGLAIDCGCFGGGGPGQGVSWWDLVRDVPIVASGAYLALRPRGPFQLDNRFLEGEVDDVEDDGRRQEADEAGTAARGR